MFWTDDVGQRPFGRWPFCLLTLICCLNACERSDHSGPQASSAAPAPPAVTAIPATHADSTRSLDRLVRAFRATVPAEQLRDHLGVGAQPSREALVRALMSAVEQHDTTNIRQLIINRGEFVALYYPTSIYARRPYLQDPAFVWFQFQENSIKGISRLVTRYGGRQVGYRGHRCPGEPVVQGANRLWQNCIVAWSEQPDSLRLFGTIMERDGKFKFVSYANDL